MTSTRQPSGSIAPTARSGKAPRLVLVKQHPQPLIPTRSVGAEHNRFGFEGGTAEKVGSKYHLFTSEMVDNPVWVRMKLAHCSRSDRLHWKREGTVQESSGDFTGQDARAALWSPMVGWDSVGTRWNLFYVAYHSALSTKTQFLLNSQGRIWRAVSRKRGQKGINGLYIFDACPIKAR